MNDKGRALFDWMCYVVRMDTVKRLMADNDPGGFTLEQYAKAYEGEWNTTTVPMTTELAQRKLRWLEERGEVREVRPGVWTVAVKEEERTE